jgi:thioester reductase-like protein
VAPTINRDSGYTTYSQGTCRNVAPADHFRAAVQDAKIGPDKDIPHISAPVIVKYITDLELLGLL